MGMSRRVVFWTSLIALALSGSRLGAGVQLGSSAGKVTVTGAAPIDASRAAARDRALHQAFRLAVERVAGVIVESETIVRNLALFEDNILTKTEGYVQDYEIISEHDSGGILTVEVEVDVVHGRLSNDLRSIGILLRRANFPVVSVDTPILRVAPLPGPSQHILTDDGALATRLAMELRSLLRDHGLEVVDPDSAGPGIPPVAYVGGSVDVADAGSIAGTSMMSSTATVSLQATEVATGATLATSRTRSRAAGISLHDARERAAGQSVEIATEELVSNLLDTWSDRVNNRDAVLLSVRGIQSFPQVAWLREAIMDRFAETEAVIERTLDVNRGTAYLEWRGRTSASALARWLSAHRFGKYKVVVVGTGGNLIQLELRTP